MATIHFVKELISLNNELYGTALTVDDFLAFIDRQTVALYGEETLYYHYDVMRFLGRCQS